MSICPINKNGLLTSGSHGLSHMSSPAGVLGDGHVLPSPLPHTWLQEGTDAIVAARCTALYGPHGPDPRLRSQTWERRVSFWRADGTSTPSLLPTGGEGAAYWGDFSLFAHQGDPHPRLPHMWRREQNGRELHHHRCQAWAQLLGTPIKQECLNIIDHLTPCPIGGTISAPDSSAFVRWHRNLLPRPNRTFGW